MRALTILLFLIFLPKLASAANPPPSELLSSFDKDHYLQSFDYVMESKKETDSYHWENRSGNGTISVGKEYLSKSGSACRNFIETYEIDRKHGTSEGAGCKRVGRKGWCRVSHGDAHICALEKSGNITDQIIDEGGDVFKKATDWISR